MYGTVHGTVPATCTKRARNVHATCTVRARAGRVLCAPGLVLCFPGRFLYSPERTVFSGTHLILPRLRRFLPSSPLLRSASVCPSSPLVLCQFLPALSPLPLCSPEKRQSWQNKPSCRAQRGNVVHNSVPLPISHTAEAESVSKVASLKFLHKSRRFHFAIKNESE